MAGPSTQKGETMKTFIQGERANSEYNNDPTDNCLSIPPAVPEYQEQPEKQSDSSQQQDEEENAAKEEFSNAWIKQHVVLLVIEISSRRSLTFLKTILVHRCMNNLLKQFCFILG